MASLRESLRLHGQRTPIEVTPLVAEGHGAALPYGLISGWRRLQALKALHAATGEPRFATVQALVRRPETAADAYVTMVEENEIRLGLSHYERARVAALATARGVFPTRTTRCARFSPPRAARSARASAPSSRSSTPSTGACASPPTSPSASGSPSSSICGPAAATASPPRWRRPRREPRGRARGAGAARRPRAGAAGARAASARRDAGDPARGPHPHPASAGRRRHPGPRGADRCPARAAAGRRARALSGPRPPVRARGARTGTCPAPLPWFLSPAGEVAEWSKAHAWKVCRRGTVSRVQIPLSPPRRRRVVRGDPRCRVPGLCPTSSWWATRSAARRACTGSSSSPRASARPGPARSCTTSRPPSSSRRLSGPGDAAIPGAIVQNEADLSGRVRASPARPARRSPTSRRATCATPRRPSGCTPSRPRRGSSSSCASRRRRCSRSTSTSGRRAARRCPSRRPSR